MVTKVSKRGLLYLLVIIFPLLISLPVILYHSYYSQKVKKGFSQENILFQDNFDQLNSFWYGFDRNPGRWEWLVGGGKEGGGYHHFHEGAWGHDSFALFKDKNFTDFSLQADLKILSGNAGIQGRVTYTNLGADSPSLGGYRCVLGDNGNLRLQRYRLTQPSGYVGDYRNPLNLREVGFAYQSNEWYSLKMELSGNTIRCFVDGVLKAEYTDTNSLSEYEISQGKTQNGAVFKNGTVGFITYGANVYFDNLVVRSLDGDGTTPTPTPSGAVTPTPGGLTLSFKVAGEGLEPAGQTKIKVSLSAVDNGFTKDIILPDNGQVENVGLEGLTVGRTYDFILSCIGYLSQKMSVTLVSGRNPSSGYLDFGTLRPGDLNGDGQINGLDWSIMKMNYGESGEE